MIIRVFNQERVAAEWGPSEEDGYRYGYRDQLEVAVSSQVTHCDTKSSTDEQ